MKKHPMRLNKGMIRLQGMKTNIIHLFIPDRLIVACGEFNHVVEHTRYRNRVTCEKCLNTPII
jgi:hypothetical protein